MKIIISHDRDTVLEGSSILTNICALGTNRKNGQKIVITVFEQKLNYTNYTTIAKLYMLSYMNIYMNIYEHSLAIVNKK